MGLFSIISDAIKPVTDIINKAVTDKDLKNKLNNAIQQKLVSSLMEKFQAQKDVLVAEMTNGNWLSESWRPILMLSFTAIIVNNYIISPYLQAMFGFHVEMVIPTQMWDLLKIGIGGYIVGQSGENIVKHWQKKSNK